MSPENTLAAFNAALESGADAIEFDVHATLDGELVVLHDFDLSRTTNGDGLVHDRTWAYISSLDAGGWFAPRFGAERVPRVHDVLSLPVPAFELEVKGLPSRALVDGVCQAIEEAGCSDRVEITGHHHVMVREIKRRLPGLLAGFFASKREPWMPERLYHQTVEASATYGGFDVVHARLEDLRMLDVDSLHAAGLLVHAGDVNGPDELLEATRLGVDHLTTNDPSAALEIFGQERASSGRRTVAPDRTASAGAYRMPPVPPSRSRP